MDRPYLASQAELKRVLVHALHAASRMLQRWWAGLQRAGPPDATAVRTVLCCTAQRAAELLDREARPAAVSTRILG